MAKQKQNPSASNRKSLARLERESRLTRTITIGTIVIVAIVLGIAAFGIIKEGVITPKQPVITLGETEVSLGAFQTRARYERFQLVNQYANYFNFMQSFGDESTRQLFESNLRQIQFQLEPFYLGATVLDEIIADLLVQREAEARGITVTVEEVDQYIAENYFLYYPQGTPTPQPTSEPFPTSTLSPQQLTLVPQEPTSTPTEAPPPAEAPTETPESAEAPEPTPAFPTPTVMSEDQYRSQLNEYLDYLNSSIDVTEEEFRAYVRADLYRQKLIDAISADIPAEEEQVWARHILVATEEEAAAVVERLNAGESFADLAVELSIDTGSGANGGDLGWFGKGQMVSAFEDAAFGMEIGEISEPVESSFGWHIIQVLGREVRPISDSRLEQLRQEYFQTWLQETRASADLVIDDSWSTQVPDTPAIPQQMLLP